jgi:hypothetical protein
MGNRYISCFLIVFFVFNYSFGQTTSDYAVQLTANVQQSPAKITLNWKLISGVTTYTVYKKSKTGTSWGAAIATLTATDSTYTDNAVIADSAYEYAVRGNGSTAPNGYIYAGIQYPAIHNRGAIILMIDSTFTDSCSFEINRLMQDLRGDGWQVLKHDVARTASDTNVKRLIINDYNSYANVQGLLLLGHVAVPYSGDLNPDGHPDHLGAWPADVYYGDINGTWTDVSVNDTGAGYALNKNKPGDGKWDQTIIPSLIELQIGRIDFYNMPAFTKTEIQLMRSYLDRDHLFKMDSLNIPHRGIVDDNFGTFGGEAFAQNGWRNFPPLVGKDNTQPYDFITTLNDSAYLWAYGCGGGWFSGAGGIGSTTDFTTNNVNSIFTMLFGSYLGDWNAQNDFMRAALCSNTPALTCCWAGRPNWFFHHMALGENIGYSARLTQNNGLYNNAGYGVNFVHVALMGDPSLRIDYIKPPSALTISTTPLNSGAHLTWSASPDAGVIGYYVYRSDSEYGSYSKISPMLTSTAFHDSVGVTNGLKYYLVRPVKLQQTPSGNYYNLGIGITDTATVSYPLFLNTIAYNLTDIALFPNPAKDKLNVLLSTGATGTATLFIVDIYGRKILAAQQQIRQGENTIIFNISNIAPGIYTLCTTIDGHTQTNKWVKLE